jgi:TolB-like protein
LLCENAQAMSARSLPRRLAALAFLDVVGYSRLMGADEEATLARWDSMRRGTIEPAVAAGGGRVVDRAGDALFVEFPAPLAALRWAVGVQRALAAAARAEPPMQVRIAVHAGEVIDGREGQLHGDAVNLTARLQAHADGGCVIVSQAVAEAVGDGCGALLDLGPLPLRGILRPVHAYSLRVAPAAPARSAAEPRPSIAVLPFRAADAADGYFGEGVIEGIIHVLSGLERLFVVARGSTLGYSGIVPDMRAAGRELGVRYLLSGSVRRAGGRLRIATELFAAESGELLRADRHEGEADDLFALQDRISLDVATTLAPQLRERELARALRQRPESVTAYDLVLQALDALHRLDADSFARARGLLAQAMAEEPGHALAHSYAAWWHVLRIAQGWSPDTAADAVEAGRLAEAAVARDAGDAQALALQGYVLGYTRRDFAGATVLLERALAAGPNCPLAWLFSSVVWSWRDDGARAVEHGRRSLRLSPLDPFVFLHEQFLAAAYYTAEAYEEAIAWGRRSVAGNPRHAATLRRLAASLVAVGRIDEACEIAQRVMGLEPKFNLAGHAARTPLTGAMLATYIERLRLAGLPA